MVTPDFSLPVIDLHRIDDEEIRTQFDDVGAVLALLSLKHIFDNVEKCARLLLQEVWERKAPYDILKPEIDYMGVVYGNTNAQEMKRILDLIVKEVGMAQSIVDTWMEQWRQEGIREGRQEGIQQGVLLEKEQLIRRLLDRKTFSPEEIASSVNADIARVREIAGRGGERS